jgi:F-type H+-transporting ATPase subunit b
MLNRVIFRMTAAAVCVTAAPAWASEGADAMNPVGAKAWQLDLGLWTAVVFVCLLAILWKFAWKPIADALDKRENGIAEKIARAESANQEARRLLAEHERKLADAKDEVRGIVDQGRRDAEKLGQELLEKARAEAAAEHVLALQQIEAAADAAVKNLADQSALMAVELAGKIVGAKLNPRDHARLIETAVNGFTSGTDVSRN